ncbi:MAG: class I SAM-dependent methyltransferase [Alphaproteobacteria bacterium]|nr:class I SAM-dependent methyltransferase [Alphaproteobacteria bacterium]
MTLEAPLVKAHWTPVPCDVCSSARQEALGERRYTVSGRTQRFDMRFQDAVCLDCGFVFAARRPDDAFLMAYYRDAHIGHRGGELHFDAEARSAVVRRHVRSGGRVVEVGANDGAFTAILKDQGFEAFGFDPVEADEARDVAKGFAGSGAGAPQADADGVVAYYVLEHVIDPRAWLAELASYLKPGGVLIVEVPNYATHPEDSLNMEHLLHFTPDSLARMLASCGFEMIETPGATVAYGQAAVARKTGEVPPPSPRPDAVQSARMAYRQAAAARQARLDAAVSAASAAKALSQGPETPIYVWGANEYAERAAPLLSKVFKSVTVLDKSPSKVGKAFDGLAEPIAHPDDTQGVDGAIFLVCSPNWNRQIAEEILQRSRPALAVIDAVTGAVLSPSSP